MPALNCIAAEKIKSPDPFRQNKLLGRGINLGNVLDALRPADKSMERLFVESSYSIEKINIRGLICLFAIFIEIFQELMV
jgi:hypothetical protein